MNRAILIVSSLALLGPAACGSSGGSAGSAFSISESTQAPAPNNPNDPIRNAFAPANNANAPLPNQNQALPNPAQAPEPGATRATVVTDTCPSLCTGVDSQCAEICATACNELNAALPFCPTEISAALACLGSAAPSCSGSQKLEIPTACESQFSALVSCLDRHSTPQGGDNQGGTPPPAKVMPPPAADGGL